MMERCASLLTSPISNTSRRPLVHRIAPRRNSSALNTRIEQLQAELAKLEVEKNCLEASVAAHRGDFERERDRCDKLIAETLVLNKVAMSARENAARLEGEVSGRRNRRRWWGRLVTPGRARGQRPADSELDEDPPAQNKPAPDPLDEELDDKPAEDDLDDEELGDGPLVQDTNLPTLYAHGDPDPRPLKAWMVKHLIPACGHGLLSGQWGSGKTFVLFDLTAAVMTCQPFLGHVVKRQSGVLWIAAEGAGEVRLRLDAVIRAKCGGMQRAPFRWYETAPVLLQKGSAEKLIAMARQADASLQTEFGLPLGLIIIDTLGACAGYSARGEESDPATGQAMMNVLKAVAQAMNCFALGVAHFGKNQELGTRGASSREDAGDIVLACLGKREVSGSVVETRLAVRKNKSGPQGQEYPFTLRVVEAPEPDEDGEPVTTMVVDWLPAGTVAGGSASGAPRPPRDPWAESRRQDQKTAVLRLKRVLMEILADRGVDLPIPPDGPVVRMVDQELVREQFYSRTPAEGTPAQKSEFRRKRFNRAVDWAEDQQLIGIGETNEVAYVWLARPEPGGEQ